VFEIQMIENSKKQEQTKLPGGEPGGESAGTKKYKYEFP